MAEAFGGVARVDESVELHAVVLGGLAGLVETRVNVGERLKRFLIGRRLVEHGLVFGNGLAEFVFFEAAPRSLEMFVDV